MNYHLQTDPVIKSKDSTTKIMRRLFIALIPIILFAFYKNGIIPYMNNKTDIYGMLYPLIFILISTISSFVFEFVFAKITKIKPAYSIFPGLFLALILPINTPISILIFGSFCASIIGKMLFGGFGYNIFNPALVGRLLIIASYASIIGSYLNPYELDTLAGSTPLSNVVNGIGTYETLVAPYGSLMNFFLGTIPGCLGETSALLCIVGFIYLTITKTIKWKIPVLYISTVFLITFMIGSLNGLGIWYPLFQILSGGLMFGAIFMATDPVTSPLTNKGQIIYGIMLGILTVTFRYLTPFPEGVLTSILTMNMLNIIVDKIGCSKVFKYAFLVLLLIGLFLGYNISTKYKVSENKDPNFNIIEKTKSDNKTTYIVTEKGYSSLIKAKIVITDKIDSIEILEQNDSFYSKVEDADYVNTLIKNQNNLENLDTVSGATISSTALKKLVQNVLKDYSSNSEEIIQEPVIPVKNFEKEEVGTQTIYTVSTDGFGGKIKSKIIVENNQIISMEILEQSDTCIYEKDASEYYQCPVVLEKVDYINSLILDHEMDTISGVTRSTKGIKDALNIVLGDLNEE